MKQIEYPNLEALFRPKSIAIAWASSDVNKIGGLALKYLLKQGYKGKIYPVNPKYNEVQGLKCYPSIQDIPQEIDAAVLVMRAQDVGPVLRDCAQKGAKAAAVPVIGFSEVGGEGKKRQDEIEAICQSSGLRICGPNTNGLLNLVDGVALGYSPAHEYVIRGRLGFVTQSGALISALVPRFAKNGIGLSYFVAAGNQLNLEVCDYARYLLDDPDTDVIALYIEGLKNADKFLDIADLALERGKPLIIMKIGRSELAARTALSHTASLVGSDRVFDTICKQKGLIRVDDFDSLISVCSVFLNCKLPKGRGVGVISTSGAATGLVADHGMDQGLFFPELSDRTKQEARAILPGWPASGEMKNLWDLPAALPGKMEDLSRRAVEIFVNDENLNVILTILAGVDKVSAMAVSSAVLEVSKTTDKPFILLVAMGSLRDFEAKIFDGSHIPIVTSAANATEAIAALIQYSQNLKKYKESRDFGESQVAVNVEEIEKSLRSGSQTLTEYESKKLLSLYGITTTEEAIAKSPQEAVEIAKRIGYPVALKVVSAQVMHKTDAGAIRLNVDNEMKLMAAFHEVIANTKKYDATADIQGVLIQEMVEGGTEVIVGVSHDLQFGATIMFGLGGIFVELLKDISIRVAPITRREAGEMVREIKGAKILEGFRGRPEADIECLINTLLSISRLCDDLGEMISAIDINPLMVFANGKGVKVVDALIRLQN